MSDTNAISAAGSSATLRVISGGQTGADVGALRAAKAAGLETGGWMPKGWKTEEGSRPEYAEAYGLSEMPTIHYPPRTERCVRESDATLVLTNRKPLDGGTKLAASIACRLHRPWFEVLILRGPDTPGWAEECSVAAAEVVAFIRQHEVHTLNVAGPRESKSPGIGGRVEAFLGEVFRLLKENGG